MVEYKCDKCNKMFNKCSNYKKHINRKFPCKSNEDQIMQKQCKTIQNTKFCMQKQCKTILNINNSILCTYCNKIFKHKNNLYKHLKERCKVKKTNEEDKQQIFDKLLKKMEQIEEENKIIMNENKELKQKIANIGCNKKNIIKNNNNSNNNININNKIQIIAYGNNKEDINKLDQDTILNILSKGFFSTVELTNQLHFNPNLPEYHNIYIPNITSIYTMVKDNDDWKLIFTKEAIDELYDDKKYIIENNLKNSFNLIPQSFQNALERWINTPEEDKKILNVKNRLKLLLYNNRNIPINTAKNIVN